MKKDAGVLATLASALNIDRQSEEALTPARKAVALAPRSEYTHRILGEVYADLRCQILARQEFAQALKLDPNSVRAQLGLYELETTLGNGEAADARLKAAMKLAPNDPVVLASAAGSGDVALKEMALARIEILVAKEPTTPDVTKLAMAAGKILDGKGEPEKAFRYFNSYRRGLYGTYDPQQRKSFIETCKTVFTADFFETRKDFALTSDKPVFVIGMPRSGTTLVEKIIARHPDATGAGELQAIPDSIRELTDGRIHSPVIFDGIHSCPGF